MISAIRHYLSEVVTKKLLCAFVLSRLDHWKSLLAGCPKYLLSKLPKVQNNAARLIYKKSRSAHVILMFHSLHWLPIEQRIEYKLSLLCFKKKIHRAHIYLSELLHFFPAVPLFCRYLSVHNTILPSALSLTRFQLSGTSFQFLSVILPLLAGSFKSSLKTFLFLKAFSSVPLP